jgi:pimeloyl-ACP methyl ester carboxylesterase
MSHALAAGPVVLVIPGGNGDAGLYERIADVLATRFRVITSDRRGFSRSPLKDSVDADGRLEADSEDARRLLDRRADGPAFVFGSSSGGIVALDLLSRYPKRVVTVLAHEPPVVRLLPDAARWLEFLDDVSDTYRRQGVDPAMQKFFGVAGLAGLPQPPDGGELPPPVAAMLARVHGNNSFWLEHELRQYPRVVPDALSADARHKLVLGGGGRDSRQPFRTVRPPLWRSGSAVAWRNSPAAMWTI